MPIVIIVAILLATHNMHESAFPIKLPFHTTCSALSSEISLYLPSMNIIPWNNSKNDVYRRFSDSTGFENSASGLAIA